MITKIKFCKPCSDWRAEEKLGLRWSNTESKWRLYCKVCEHRYYLNAKESLLYRQKLNRKMKREPHIWDFFSTKFKFCKKCGEWRVEEELHLRQRRKRDHSVFAVYCNVCVKEYYKNNKEMMNSLQKEWWRRNKEKLTPVRREWAIANKDKVKEIDSRRRARIANSEGTYTEEEFYTMCQSLDLTCQGCNIKFPLEDLTRDHIIPLFRGGSNYIENIQPLCLRCNSSKGTKTMEEWKA